MPGLFTATPLYPRNVPDFVPPVYDQSGRLVPPATPAATSSLGTGLGAPTDSSRINLAAAPDMATLSQLINQINQTANQSRVPGGAALETQSSQNIGEELAGKLPQSYVDRLRQQAAERGMGFGPDNPSTQASVQRQLGVDELALRRQGQQDLSGAYNRAAPLFNIESQLLTPGQVQQNQQFQQSLAQRQFETALAHSGLLGNGYNGGGGIGRYPVTRTGTQGDGLFPTWDNTPQVPQVPQSPSVPSVQAPDWYDYQDPLGYSPASVPDLSLTSPEPAYTDPGSLFEQVYDSTQPSSNNDWFSGPWE